MIVFHAIIARKHGEIAGYPVIAAFGSEGHTAVIGKYDEIVGENGETFREENAELLMFTIDGLAFAIEHHHTFEDPKTLASRREQAELAEAIRVREQHEAAQASFEAAKDRVTEAKGAIGTLTAGQKKLLTAHDERVAADRARAAEASGDEKAQQKASVAEQKRQKAAAKELQDRAEKLGIDHTGALIGSTVGGPQVKDLSEHTIDELKEIAAAEKADLTGLTKKDDIIEAIELNRAPLTVYTIPQLQMLAERENIDLTGKTVKADIIEAIELARRTPPPLPAGEGGPTL